LNPGGVVLLLQSSASDSGETQKSLEGQGFTVEKAASERFFFEELFVLRAERK